MAGPQGDIAGMPMTVLNNVNPDSDTQPWWHRAPMPHQDTRLLRWLVPLVRAALVIGALLMAWVINRNLDRWIGASRYEATDDAYLVGDLTPLGAKVSGYVSRVLITDYQSVHKGDLLVEIEPSDYRAALAEAAAQLAAAQANLLDIGPQKTMQRALIRQAEANIQASSADLTRYHLEADRQRALLVSRLAGTQQLVEQSSANERRSQAALMQNLAQLDQQKAALISLDVHEKQLSAQVSVASAQLELARNNLGYTRAIAPADGMAGQRQVRPGQFVNVGTELVAVMPLPNIWVIANYKETQMTRVRVGQPVSIRVDAFPDLVLRGQVQSWSPGTGSTFALLAPDNATGNFTKVVQRMPVKIVLEPHAALGSLVRPGMSVEATIDTESPRAVMEHGSRAGGS